MFYNLILFVWSMFEFCVNISVILAIKLTEMIHVCISLTGHTKVGYSLYFYTYSSWKGRAVYMEDLYVMPEFRGKETTLCAFVYLN